MKAYINELKDVCNKHKIEEKLLIVDSYSIGEQILHEFVQAGYSSINLKVKTIHDLAIEIVELRLKGTYKKLVDSLGTQFIFQILNDLKMKSELSYFKEMEMTISFSKSVFKMIKELRLSGVTSGNINKSAFLSSEKANDIEKIMRQFEDTLTMYHFKDDASIYLDAINNVQPDSNTIHILQSNLSLSKLEEQFLMRYLPNTIYKLPLPKVYGITTPEYSKLQSVEWSEPTALSYLYQQEDLPPNAKTNLTIFKSKTEEVELKQIFTKIKNDRLSLDECIVFYTKSGPYVTTLFQTAEKHNIPITFGEGLPVSFSNPGRLIERLLKWINSQYSVTIFLEILHEGIIHLSEEAPSKAEITKHLRNAKIGWGQDRYDSQLERVIKDYEHKIRSSSEISKLEYYENQIKKLKWLKKFFIKLFKKLPILDSRLNYQQVLRGLEYCIHEFGSIYSALDEAAKIAMEEQIEKVRPYTDEILSKYEVFEKVRELLLSIRVLQSRPKPGYLHVTNYTKGIYHSRSNVFIVGLDNQSFPGKISEDPLLLDEERKNLSDSLVLMQNKGKENLYTMVQLLSLTEGPVHVSFSNFNINDNRSLNPSHIFLQMFRLATGNENAEFDELKAENSVLFSDVFFEEKDYWNYEIDKEADVKLDNAILERFTNLVNGIQANEARQLDTFTKYDGKIFIDTKSYDPRLNKDRIMSAGKLELIATCSYSYFLQEILQVKPIEEWKYDPYSWLDAATRGTLLHSIFEQFFKEIKVKNMKPNYVQHESLLLKLAKELIQKEKEIITPPSDRVFNLEAEDIYEACRIFLKEEEEYAAKYDSLYFEYTFGMNGIAPAEIEVDEKETIQLSGKIDRVDKSVDGHYHIIDYKTGSTYNYNENKSFRGGRQLQHFIYAVAIEQHLKLENGAVLESSYYFPTSKGEGRRYVRKQNEVLRANGKDILKKLIDVIKHGHFSMTDDVNDCKFCQLKDVCRRSYYDKDTLEAKQMDNSAEGVLKFKGVRIYE